MSAARVAVVVFPGTNSEDETVDALCAAGLAAEKFWWTDSLAALARYDAYVLAGGFAHEDRVRAGAIAARTPIFDTVAEQAQSGKLLLGLCNGAQMIAEKGLLGPVALARNQPGRHFVCRHVDVVVDAPDRCAFTRGLAPGMTLRMVAAHGEGRFYGADATLDDLDERGLIPLRYAGGAPNGAMRDAAGISNEAGNVLALMPHPERAAWNFNVAFDSPALRGYDPNAAAGGHAIFRCMAESLRNA